MLAGVDHHVPGHPDAEHQEHPATRGEEAAADVREDLIVLLGGVHGEALTGLGEGIPLTPRPPNPILCA